MYLWDSKCKHVKKWACKEKPLPSPLCPCSPAPLSEGSGYYYTLSVPPEIVWKY